MYFISHTCIIVRTNNNGIQYKILRSYTIIEYDETLLIEYNLILLLESLLYTTVLLYFFRQYILLGMMCYR